MRPTPPRFFYFDVGNVLLSFERERLTRQVSEAVGITAERIWDVIYDTDVYLRFERGEMTSQEFYEFFCDRIGKRADYVAFRQAACDIFELNTTMVPIVAHLRASGLRLGILSNTNETHWDFIVSGRYTLFCNYFDCYALSFRVGELKPEPAIYRAAAELAQVSPQEIFFVDDREENVVGARDAGFDAVQYTTALELAEQLRRRGVRMNY
jgi:putative hydrolase of the HAD superfamily